MDSLQNSVIQDLITQYRAESLPAEVVNVLRDFFMQKPSVTQAISNADNYAVTESFKAINFSPNGQDSLIVNSEVKGSIDDDFSDLIGSDTCDAFSDAKVIKSITDASIDIPENVNNICDRVYDQYFANGCGCIQKCHEQFPRHVAFEAHLDALDLDQYCPSHINHQHLLLLGAMNALVKNHAISTSKKNSDKERINARTFFKFRGKDVCRKFFLYVFGCGEKRIKNVMKQFLTKGILPSQHINASSVKALVKTDPNHQRREALIFIMNYAQQNALQLPGRFVCNSGKFADLYLLPNHTSLTRRYIFELYVQACGELYSESISFALWNELWDLQYPNVMTFNDRSEVCFECRRYQHTILGSSSKVLAGDESHKLVATQRYLNHLNEVQNETVHYRSLLDRCRDDYEETMKKTDLESTIRHSFISTLGSMHYTFDWFSTISLPYTSNNRNTPIYFKSGYKVAFFGVSIEPLRKYILYIIPEFVCHLTESLPNITMSLMHHFFSTYMFNEKETFIHFANNSVEQMKNSLIFSYFMWRSLIGHHDKVNVSFLPSGHTRCWNDLFMGVFRKKLRSCSVNSLQEIKTIAERSVLEHIKSNHHPDCSTEKSLIKVVLVGNDNEELLVPLYNWQDRFALINKLNPSIMATNHHFEINMEIPGYILCRKSITSEIISYRLIANENLTMFDQELPFKFILEPLPIERRYYLHENINKHFLKLDSKTNDGNSKLWDCDPSLVSAMQMANSLKRLSSEEMVNSKSKRTKKLKSDSNGANGRKNPSLPTCSYCNETGHRESIFGKIRCPKKKQDSAILEPLTTVEMAAQDFEVEVATGQIMAMIPHSIEDNEDIMNMATPSGSIPIVTNEDFSPHHSINVNADSSCTDYSTIVDSTGEPIMVDPNQAVISLMEQTSPIVNDFSDDEVNYDSNYQGLLD